MGHFKVPLLWCGTSAAADIAGKEASIRNDIGYSPYCTFRAQFMH